MKTVTPKNRRVAVKPPKKGKQADRTEKIATNRKEYRGLAMIPVAEIADSVDPNKPLTEKAKLFVKFWAQGESIQSAAARAGYADSATYAYKVVHLPQAIALYEEEKRLYAEAAQVTRKDVMDMLKEAYDMAKLVSEPSSMVAAAREIGKMAGFYETRVKITVNGGKQQEMARMTDDELIALINAASAAPALPAPTAETEE